MKKIIMLILSSIVIVSVSYSFELHTGWFNEYEYPFIETTYHFSINGDGHLFPINNARDTEDRSPAGYIFYDYNFGEIYKNIDSDEPKRENMFLFKQYKRSGEDDETTKFYIQRYDDENIPFYIFNVEENEYLFAGIADFTKCTDNSSVLHLIYLTERDKYEWYQTKRDLKSFHEYIKGKWKTNEYFSFYLEEKKGFFESFNDNRKLNWPIKKSEDIVIDFFSNTEMKWIEDKLLYYYYEIVEHTGDEDIYIKTMKNDLEDAIGVIPINENAFILYKSKWVEYEKAAIYNVFYFKRNE